MEEITPMRGFDPGNPSRTDCSRFFSFAVIADRGVIEKLDKSGYINSLYR